MKTVIEGLQEGLNAIADALEGGSGQQVPAPEAADTGKVLKATGAGTVDWQEDAIGGGVPTVTSGDDGKVLTADYTGGVGTYSWEDAPEGLPDSSQAANQSVLMKTATGPQWEQIREVPSGGTNGQVLTNDGFGGYGWETPSGGGGTTIYMQTATVEYNDKDDEYFAAVQPSASIIGGTTKVLAVYNNVSTTVSRTLSVGYTATAYAMMNEIYVTFLSNPDVSSVQIIFATPTTAS